MDAELYERVRSIVHEEADALIAEGRVTLEEGAVDAKDRLGRFEVHSVGGDIRLKPARPGATDISMSICGDVVAFGTGRADAWHEIWSTADPDWESTVRQLIQSVRDGRYSERVMSGWFFPLKVEMRFGDVPSGRRRRRNDYVVRYSSTLASEEGRLPMPAEGEFSYEPW